ncbi:hypothetical protein JXD20_04280 [Candidatus Peregrinibacteria bacterium]|nr:hypothetical protein [Candidatus Peregrinibacteria bacterium]
MEKVVKRNNKAVLIAAALIITGATAIFGTYASESTLSGSDNNCPFVSEDLTDDQKAALEEAKDLFDSGDIKGAKAILEEAGIKPPMGGPLNHGQFVKNLTEEQKTKLQEAHELMQAGDIEGAKAIIDELGIKPLNKFRLHPHFSKNLSEAQKEMLKEAHELMKAGDTEGAQAIMDELGIEIPKNLPGAGFGKGHWKKPRKY